ncbi:MAG TPA: AAA family ATPase [Solirubrobacteraceae bacterium]
MAVRLRGRSAEFQMIGDRVKRLLRGEGGVILIRGDAGIGKSALLAGAEALAEEYGARVFHGASNPSGQMVPLAPVLEALMSSDDPPVNAEVLRELSGSPDQRFWVLQELESGLEAAAVADPLVVGIDDLQWADAASLIAVGTLPRRLATHRILWIFVVRSGRPEPAIDQALGRIRAADPDILDLRRLDDQAVDEISEDLLGGSPDGSLRETISRSLGHPFLLVELLRGLQDEGLVRVDQGVARLARARVPQRLLESVTNQLNRLSKETRDLLDMASVLGRSFSIAELAALVEEPVSGLVDSAREALDAGLIMDQGERLAFRHDLVREAIDAGIPVALKRDLQRRAMEVMLQQGSPPADVASLVMEVARPGDRAATQMLERGATEIGQVSPSVAVPLILRSLALTSPGDPAYVGRFLASLAMLVTAGQAAQALKLLDEQSAIRGIGDVAMAQARLSVVPLLMQYSATDAVRQCRAALQLPGISGELRIHAYSLMANSLDVLGAPAEAADAVRAAVDAMGGRDDPALRLGVLLPQAVAAYAAGDWHGALRYADTATQLVTKGYEPHRWLVEAWRSLILIGVGQTDTATLVIDAGSERALRNGVMGDVRIWSMVRSREFLSRGALSDARAEAEAVVELSDEMATGVRDGYINHVAKWVLADVALHTGDTDGLTAALGWASRAVSSRECPMSERMGAWILTRLKAARGLAPSDVLDADMLDPLTVGLIRVSDPRRYDDASILVQMLSAAGQRDDAIAVHHRLRAALSATSDFPFLEAACVHVEAVLNDDWPLAEEAARLYRECPAPLVRALALEDAGRLAPINKPDRAVRYLDAAHEIYADAGAARDAARVRGLLRRRGVRRSATAPARSPHWPELTDSEAAVVRLVADGATNREVAEQLYLSPHTVNAHLRHVFTKLGIRSRVELARLSAERDATRSRLPRSR